MDKLNLTAKLGLVLVGLQIVQIAERLVRYFSG
jgi:hypothetical protein